MKKINEPTESSRTTQSSTISSTNYSRLHLFTLWCRRRTGLLITLPRVVDGLFHQRYSVQVAVRWYLRPKESCKVSLKTYFFVFVLHWILSMQINWLRIIIVLTLFLMFKDLRHCIRNWHEKCYNWSMIPDEGNFLVALSWLSFIDCDRLFRLCRLIDFNWLM